MTFSRSNNIAGFESRCLLDPQLVLSLLYHVLPFWEMESQEWKGQPRHVEDCSFRDVLFLWTPDPWHVLDTAFRSQELGVGVWGRNHRFYLATNRIESRFRLMWKTMMDIESREVVLGLGKEALQIPEVQLEHSWQLEEICTEERESNSCQNILRRKGNDKFQLFF